MRTLVTGGAGFIGSHLVEELLSQGHEVIVLDNFSTGRIENIKHIKNRNFKLVNTDICEREALSPHFKDVDWVFHLAALADIVPSIKHPERYHAANVDGTINVLEESRINKIKKFIYAASSSCYGIPAVYPTPETAPIKPEYPYAVTKYIGEAYAMYWHKIYKLPVVSLRLFNVYGPRARTSGTYGAVFGVFLAQKINGKPFTVVGDGNQSRDFTFVSDVVGAFVVAAESDLSCEIFNIGSGGHYSIKKLVSLLKGDVVYIPKRPGEPDCTYADISKIRKMLGWKPEVSFEEGVKIMLENINYWKDAPLWDTNSISKATKEWFYYLSD